jgi:hypothetical protein
MLGLKEFAGYAVAGLVGLVRKRVRRVPDGMDSVWGNSPFGVFGALGQVRLEDICGMNEGVNE